MKRTLFCLLLTVILCNCATLPNLAQNEQQNSEQKNEESVSQEPNLDTMMLFITNCNLKPKGSEETITGKLFYSYAEMAFFVRIDKTGKVYKTKPNFEFLEDVTEQVRERGNDETSEP